MDHVKAFESGRQASQAPPLRDMSIAPAVDGPSEMGDAPESGSGATNTFLDCV